MPHRLAAMTSFAVVAAVFSGCLPAATEPKPNGYPYQECRLIVQWIRVTTKDTEAQILKWGPREVVTAETGEAEAVIIEARYRANINRIPGVWSQTFRVQNKRVSEETERIKEDTADESRAGEGS
ncbi:MAG TPA: hypothetical protein VMG10_16235 [Gemmataceae bacterium]|nr:hypothetical protein [Gemmataceae bacterium]